MLYRKHICYAFCAYNDNIEFCCESKEKRFMLLKRTVKITNFRQWLCTYENIWNFILVFVKPSLVEQFYYYIIQLSFHNK